MDRKILLQQVMNLLEYTRKDLCIILGKEKSFLSMIMSGTRVLSDDSIYRLYYHIKGKHTVLDQTLQQEIRRIEG